jgi:CRISPR-associated protein (TIGR02710 family)
LGRHGDEGKRLTIMEPPEKQILAMLVNVGGATSPAVHTLNEQKPRFICFFVSPESKAAIREKILPTLDYEPEHYDWIETQIPQNLLACYKALADHLPLILEKWGVLPEELGVEYTAGTKPMSVAAVLATIDRSSEYFYVGSKDPSGRDRDGIGVVLDGREFTWFQTNPWEELAISARKEIALLFNHGRFTDAQERTLRLAKVAPPDMRQIYEALSDLIEGYALWDRFEYKRALNQIGKARSSLRVYIAGREEPLRATLDEVDEHVGFLKSLMANDPESHRLDLLDMLANATRRAEVAKKYDDAVARLYSALEALARNRLLHEYQIKTHKVMPEQIPENDRAEFLRKYGDPEHPAEGMRLGLEANYQLLAIFGDELGDKYLANEEALKKVLYARNQSRLAHGNIPVKPETYQEMRNILMSFAEVTEAELPQFPTLRM